MKTKKHLQLLDHVLIDHSTKTIYRMDDEDYELAKEIFKINKKK